MRKSELQGLRQDLHDLYDVLAGIGMEIDAVKEILRAAVKEATGEDPLAGTMYEDDHDGPLPSFLNH